MSGDIGTDRAQYCTRYGSLSTRTQHEHPSCVRVPVQYLVGWAGIQHGLHIGVVAQDRQRDDAGGGQRGPRASTRTRRGATVRVRCSGAGDVQIDTGIDEQQCGVSTDDVGGSPTDSVPSRHGAVDADNREILSMVDRSGHASILWGRVEPDQRLRTCRTVPKSSNSARRSAPLAGSIEGPDNRGRNTLGCPIQLGCNGTAYR
ncbi:hypothetical protein CH298_02255 [Rhodococcoides fascians]|nr:hypothetical protein CH303_02255 [Rhodococcus fascians]OZF23023.1 hypothetical protein CH298_02255 [Rhodococcus fascians]OZF24737.1 hypothetical protein CH297_02255 [Rhodococcus fascians]OZF72986.1 hypothetical protein CH308_02260 [Rhodococcus fascians]OZF74151.1 hypothetical protein CH307_02255 [Rhodococcus fascians]